MLISADTATMAQWATVVATFIGPIIGVLLAFIFSRRESKRHAAVTLFQEILDETQKFVWLFRSFNNSMEFREQTIRTQKEAEDLPKDSVIHPYLAENIRRMEAEFSRLTDEIQAIQHSLAGRHLTLYLLFGKKSSKCSDDIDKLLTWRESVPIDGTLTAETSNAGMEICQSIARELGALAKL